MFKHPLLEKSKCDFSFLTNDLYLIVLLRMYHASSTQSPLISDFIILFTSSSFLLIKLVLNNRMKQLISFPTASKINKC